MWCSYLPQLWVFSNPYLIAAIAQFLWYFNWVIKTEKFTSFNIFSAADFKPLLYWWWSKKKASTTILLKLLRLSFLQNYTELTDTPVRQRSYEKHEINWDKCFICQRSYEKHEINWDKCFICQRDSTEKLQSSVEARSTDPVKAYEELGERIVKFESVNALPVPMEVDDLSGGEASRTSLFNHSAKFHKTCKLKFGKEKLEKAIKRHEKQDNSGTLEKHSTLKGKWKLWCYPVFIMFSHSYHRFFFYPDDSASGVLWVLSIPTSLKF